MKCSVDECDRQARYKSHCLCQKHYFRKWRNGATDLVRKPPAGRNVTPNGYVRVYVGSHQLNTNNGYIFEHRKVAFEKYGMSLPDCELCGTELNWETCHIDHIDNDRQNNHPDNLRPLCRGCNVHRDYPEPHTFNHCHPITFGGVTMTAKAWALATGGFISRSALMGRLKAGMSVEAALFTPKATHGKGAEPPYTREGLIEIARHYRAEARRISRLSHL